MLNSLIWLQAIDDPPLLGMLPSGRWMDLMAKSALGIDENPERERSVVYVK